MLYNTQDLKEWTGIKQEARLIKWLDEHGIEWWRGAKDQICTTLPRIERSFGPGGQPIVEFMEWDENEPG